MEVNASKDATIADQAEEINSLTSELVKLRASSVETSAEASMEAPAEAPGAGASAEPVAAAEEDEGKWKAHTDAEGNTYYVNSETNETSWGEHDQSTWNRYEQEGAPYWYVLPSIMLVLFCTPADVWYFSW